MTLGLDGLPLRSSHLLIRRGRDHGKPSISLEPPVSLVGGQISRVVGRPIRQLDGVVVLPVFCWVLLGNRGLLLLRATGAAAGQQGAAAGQQGAAAAGLGTAAAVAATEGAWLGWLAPSRGAAAVAEASAGV